MKRNDMVNELRQIISNYYAEKATKEVGKLWDAGEWNALESWGQFVLTETLFECFRRFALLGTAHTPLCHKENRLAVAADRLAVSMKTGGTSVIS